MMLYGIGKGREKLVCKKFNDSAKVTWSRPKAQLSPLATLDDPGPHQNAGASLLCLHSPLQSSRRRSVFPIWTTCCRALHTSYAAVDPRPTTLSRQAAGTRRRLSPPRAAAVLPRRSGARRQGCPARSAPRLPIKIVALDGSLHRRIFLAATCWRASRAVAQKDGFVQGVPPVSGELGVLPRGASSPFAPAQAPSPRLRSDKRLARRPALPDPRPPPLRPRRRPHQPCLWTRLPELTFHFICPGPLDDALAMVSTTAALPRLDIRIINSHSLAPARISSLLQAAARLAPAELSVTICGDIPHNSIENAVELPFFHRTTSIWLWASNVRFTLPPAGYFPVLESLTLFSWQIDLTDLLPRCPHLRKLCISIDSLHSVTVHAPLLEELGVYCYERVQQIDISAPMLKKLQLRAFHGLTAPSNEFSLSYSAPVVEELSWECARYSSVGFGQIWRLTTLRLETQEIPVRDSTRSQLRKKTKISCPQQQQRPRVHVLSLDIGPSDILSHPSQSITQAISQFLVSSFSILELNIPRHGHVYGPVVLHVIGIFNFVQCLKVELYEVSQPQTCYINCPCDQPNNWRSQVISLTCLKEVEIKGFRGENHAVDLLKVILRNATMLESVIRMTKVLVDVTCSLSYKCSSTFKLIISIPQVVVVIFAATSISLPFPAHLASQFQEWVLYPDAEMLLLPLQLSGTCLRADTSF
ncbi:hypothetical protein EJB05_12667, partial [Eragrostis curvula]